MKKSMGTVVLAAVILGLGACQGSGTGPDETAVQRLEMSVAGSAAEKSDPPKAQARAKGIVTGTNPPENKGTIKSATNETYHYNVDAGHTVDGYRPKAGDEVEFTPGPGRVAYRITKAADEACAEQCLQVLKEAILACETNYDPAGCGRDDACRREVEELRARCTEAAWAEYDRCVSRCKGS